MSEHDASVVNPADCDEFSHGLGEVDAGEGDSPAEPEQYVMLWNEGQLWFRGPFADAPAAEAWASHQDVCAFPVTRREIKSSFLGDLPFQNELDIEEVETNG
jgi:hypothetical protein